MNTSEFVLGTAQFSGNYGLTNASKRFTKDEIVSILDIAATNGIHQIDTALSYFGVYELLSMCLPSVTAEYKFEVATKFNFRDLTIRGFYDLFELSQNTFSTANLNVIFVHDWDKLTTKDFEVIHEVTKQFPNVRIGLSIYNPDDIDRIISKFTFISLLQLPLSILNQTFVPYLDDLQKNGIEIWARSIFLQGAIDWNSPLNTFSQHPSIIKLKELGHKLDTSGFALALDFIKCFSVKKIVGVTSPKQLIEIFNLVNSPKFEVQYESFASNDQLLIDPRKW